MTNSEFRVGIGQDSHSFDFKKDKKLVLGGIVIEGHAGCRAHSDGDIVLHSLFNAISSALGGRSIGYYHSDKDPRTRGISSKKHLATVKKYLIKKDMKLTIFLLPLKRDDQN